MHQRSSKSGQEYHAEGCRTLHPWKLWNFGNWKCDFQCFGQVVVRQWWDQFDMPVYSGQRLCMYDCTCTPIPHRMLNASRRYSFTETYINKNAQPGVGGVGSHYFNIISAFLIICSVLKICLLISRKWAAKITACTCCRLPPRMYYVQWTYAYSFTWINITNVYSLYLNKWWK